MIGGWLTAKRSQTSSTRVRWLGRSWSSLLATTRTIAAATDIGTFFARPRIEASATTSSDVRPIACVATFLRIRPMFRAATRGSQRGLPSVSKTVEGLPHQAWASD